MDISIHCEPKSFVGLSRQQGTHMRQQRVSKYPPPRIMDYEFITDHKIDPKTIKWEQLDDEIFRCPQKILKNS